MLNPVNVHHPAEMETIGRMVLAYSELDLVLCHAAGLVMNDKFAMLNALHSVKQEAARLDIIRHLTAGLFGARGLKAEFQTCIDAMKYCRSIRNQYAHATWGSAATGLEFGDLTDTDWNNGPKMNPTSLSLLREQEAFFEYTKECLLYLEGKVSDPVRTHRQYPTRIQTPKRHLGP